jgi:hypothetical protein
VTRLRLREHRRYPRRGPGQEDVVDYSSIKPDLEGDVVTEPGTTATGNFYVWTHWQPLAFRVTFREAYIEDGIPLGFTRLVIVESDEGDVIETVGVNGSAALGTIESVPVDRLLISGGDIDDEFSYKECAGLASYAPELPEVGAGDTRYTDGYPISWNEYDPDTGALLSSHPERKRLDGDGNAIGAYGYVAILAADGL